MAFHKSPAYRFVELMWINHHVKRSWLRLNGVMREALGLAIAAGLRFDPEDFDDMHEAMSGSQWFGADGEHRYYARAVESKNISACRAWEKFKNREPFFYKGRRLYVGASLDNGEVTSFSDDGKHIVVMTRVAPGKRSVMRLSRKEAAAGKELVCPY